MILPDAPWRHRAGMDRLLAALDAAGGQARYVGGAVRDTLLGEDAADVDLATRLRPEEVADRLKRARLKAVPTGIAHGTITAVLPDSVVEVTTLRRDVSTDGRRATIAYTDDWREDAARRDFTINALSADPITGEVHDYFGGAQDLAERRVRFIGDPLTRIAEDHLRILRFFRFHARFGRAEPDVAALDACTARANDLMALSRERIADELIKLLALPDPASTLALMVDHKILLPVLSEIDAAGVTALNALVAAEKQAGAAIEPIRRLAALLPADPDQAQLVAARLRLSKRAAKRLISAAGRGEDKGGDPRALAYRIGIAEALDRLLLTGAKPDALARLDGWSPPRLAVTGGDLIALGLPPGPVVAGTLQKLEQAWVDGGFTADDRALRILAEAQVAAALRSAQ